MMVSLTTICPPGMSRWEQELVDDLRAAVILANGGYALLSVPWLAHASRSQINQATVTCLLAESVHPSSRAGSDSSKWHAEDSDSALWTHVHSHASIADLRLQTTGSYKMCEQIGQR
jgi:hypothetical protein